MSESNAAVLYEQYSTSEDYLCEVYENSMHQFDVWLFQYDKKWDGYRVIDEERRLVDSLEDAKQAVSELLAKYQ